MIGLNDDPRMKAKPRCPRCSGYLVRVSGREYDHRECLNCGFSDEPSAMTAIESRLEVERMREAEAEHSEMPAGD